MATCKDCLHYDACYIVNVYGDDDNENCKLFKNKADVALKSEVVAEIIKAFDNYISEMTVSKYGTLQECKDARWAVKTAVNFVLKNKHTEDEG